MPESEGVRTLFSGIAGRYDLTNRVLSGGLDVGWRRALVREVAATQPGRLADLATGSGDVAFALADALSDTVEILGFDFCEPMLEQARQKQQGRRHGGSIPFALGDCLNLPLESASLDAITISFGYRNLEKRDRGLQEFQRVLRPGGHLFILEFSQPYRLVRPFYFFYLKHILPHIARLLTRDKAAYDYLAGSIEQFPSVESLRREIEAAGFEVVRIRRLTWGTVAVHHAAKRNDIGS